MFSTTSAQPISLKSFRGLGQFPNKIARVYKHEHCLPSAFRSWQVMRSGYRHALLARMVSSGVGTHRICLNAVNPKIPDSFSEDRLMFSSAGAQPISLKSFRGLGHFPNKIARVYKHEHCLPSAFRSWQVMRSGYRRALLARMASSDVGTHRICLLFCKEIPVVPRRISQV